MTVMVIGGCGFIGSHIVHALDSSDIPSIVYDKFVGSPSAFRHCTYYGGDIGDVATIQRCIEQHNVTQIIHLVSTTLPKSSNDNMSIDLTTNVVQMVALLDMFIASGIQKVVFMSSGGTVYGMPHTLPVSESHPTEPICSYGIGKLAIEKYLALYKHLHGLDYVVLRAANPYGKGQDPLKGQGIIANFVNKLHHGLPLEVWGDGCIIRDYFDVRDLANLTQQALLSKHCGVFNAGSGVGTSINDIINKLASITKIEPKVVYKEPRLLDVPAIILNCEKAERIFGWRASIGLETGLSDYIKWYLTNY